MTIFQPSHLLFTTTLLMGVIISISSSSWFTVWMGLELNLLSFIPLLTSTSNRYLSESSLKYFLIQALGSAAILASAPSSLLFSETFSPVIVMALLLKMGAAPVHFWFPPIMQGIRWPQGLILMTIQKVAPMVLIGVTYTPSLLPMIAGASVCSALVGAVGGLNQTLTRKIMSYSSINHLSWMLAAISFNEQVWIIYFLSYSMISSSLVLLFQSRQIYHFSQISNFGLHSKVAKLAIFLSFLSLGGLPPFFGFFPKWMIIQELASSSSFLWIGVLIFSALLTLFYYLRLSVSSIMLSSSQLKPSIIPTNNNSMLVATWINMTLLFFPLVLLLAC